MWWHLMVFGVQQGLKVAAELARKLGVGGRRAPDLRQGIKGHAPHLGSVPYAAHGQQGGHHLFACLQHAHEAHSAKVLQYSLGVYKDKTRQELHQFQPARLMR